MSNYNKQFRDQGAAGAILDEYEAAIQALVQVIQPLSAETLSTVVDPTTQDPDCHSIQTILTHVVQSGYTYVVEIRKWLGETVPYRDKVVENSVAAYITGLGEMFAFNEALFVDYPNLSFEEKDPAKKIHTRWGQYYDIEQLFEHAIVHILRHRRQIERFILQMN